MKNLLIILISFISSVSIAQINYEDFKSKTDCKHDTCIIREALSKYKEIRYINPDSAKYFAEFALTLAKKTNSKDLIAESMYSFADNMANNANYDLSLKYCDSALSISESENLFLTKSKILNLYGIIFSDQGLYDKSIEFYNKSADIGALLNDKSVVSKAYSNIGVSYYYKSEFQSAIDYYLKSLKILEELKDSANIAIQMSNLGVFYQMQTQYDKALETLFRSLDFIPKNSFKTRADAYNNIAVTYTYTNNLDKALEYYNEAKILSEKVDDFRGIATSYNNMADLYKRMLQLDKAIEMSKKAIEVCEKNNIPTDNTYYYRSLAVALFENRNFTQAESYLEKSIQMCDEQGNKKLLADNYYLMADIFRMTKNFEKATEYMFLFKELNDSVQQQTYSENIAEMETKYQTEKKQQEIEILNKDNLIQAERINKQRALIFTFIGVFIIILIFSIIILRLYRQKRKANIELKLKNVQITSQKEEIEAQRDEIEQQRDYVTSQRDTIAIQKQELTDSIKYAKRIQEALLPQDELFEILLKEYFILFKPRNIVSGDFFWIKEYNEKVVVTVADCTGHGVPGAFMSMLGIAFLNEIINTQSILSSGEVLDLLRSNIILSLHQSGKEGDSKDGMDISMCIIDKANKILQFSGANNPLWIVKNKKFVKSESNAEELDELSTFNSCTEQGRSVQLEELKGDKQPIAIYPEMKKFSTNEFSYEEIDSIYLFSDGFADQFGGPKGKKFMYKHFKELILSNSIKSMSSQKTILESEIENWMSYNDINYEQTDDITVIGIKL